MPLSDLAIRNAKPGDKPYKKADFEGLYLLVKTNGKRLWRMDYRFAGKRKTMAFGAYPSVSLQDARARRDEARKTLAAGNDPGVQKREAREAEAASVAHTFESVSNDYLERIEHEGASPRTLSKNRWLLLTVASPLCSRPIAQIQPSEILSVLQKVELSGRLETARRLRATIGAVFRLAIVTLRATTDPSAHLVGATKRPRVKHRSAIVDPKKLGWMMSEIDRYDGFPTIRCALQFAALTAARPGEVRLARWDEFDTAQRTWTIPAERMKRPRLDVERLSHMVPLSDQALRVLEEARRLTNGHSFAFSSVRAPDKALSDMTLNAALRRIGISQDEHMAHGFRSSFSTILNERRENAEIIEICLAHQDPNGVRRVYNRSVRWDERVALMQRWADLLDEFRKL
ncbi:tyrosine-type recombinase/integrase [Bosea vestrisii]|uniref:Tyrosine-type recombinase/integrase n=1 Tax=Bosea vestrisii TaxID=151416 RepID=A0ABW0HCL5_9HYPH